MVFDSCSEDFETVSFKSPVAGDEIFHILNRSNIFPRELYADKHNKVDRTKAYETVLFDKSETFVSIKLKASFRYIAVLYVPFNITFAKFREMLKKNGIDNNFNFLSQPKVGQGMTDTKQLDDLRILEHLGKNFTLEVSELIKQISIVDSYGTVFVTYNCSVTETIDDIKSRAESDHISFVLEEDFDIIYNAPIQLVVSKVSLNVPVYLLRSLAPVKSDALINLGEPICSVDVKSDDGLSLLRTLITEKMSKKGKTVSFGQFISENFTRYFIDDDKCVSEALWSLSNCQNTVTTSAVYSKSPLAIVITGTGLFS